MINTKDCGGTLRVIGSEAGLKWGLVHNLKAKGNGGFGVQACAFPYFGCLEDIAAQPLRYCRLTAQLHHQNAATPNKEGK